MEQEVYWRLGVFFAILAAVALWETIYPKRPWQLSRVRRWTNHISLSILNTVVVRLVIPLTAAAYALTLESEGVGLLNLVDLPNWIAIVIAVLILDLAIYAQHVWFHKLEFFWRFHRMHHTDLDIDVTTGVRFHPVEIVISMLIKFAVISLLGPPAMAVIVFEIVLNATSMFNHGNVRIPVPIDRVLRLFLVTPDMHRVHHSEIRTETDSNFGFNLPWWDRLFGTYRDQPQEGHLGMSIGLPIFRDGQELRLDRLISQPFRKPQPDQ
ncbi:MAG: sterol desaturase family protein [Acidiferrobacterales bacterium]|nr:sterol desaturase family protein [Acidiferrobacterales bacterium]